MSAEADRAMNALAKLAMRLPRGQARTVLHAVQVIEQQQIDIARHLDVYRQQSHRLVDAEIRRAHGTELLREALALTEPGL